MPAKTIPLFPLGTVLFPDGYLPLQIFEVRYLDMVRKALAADSLFGVVTLLNGAEVRTPEANESLAATGTLALIRSFAAPMPALMQIQCIGQSRFRLISSERQRNGLWTGEVELLVPDQVVSIPDELDDTATALGRLLRTLQEQPVPEDEMPFQAPFRLDEAGWVANRWAELLPLATQDKLRLLEQDNPLLRLELIQDALHEHGVL